MQLDQIVLWLDMQFSPQMADHIFRTYGIKAISSYTLNFNTKDDYDIFMHAKKAANVIFHTKDKDYIDLLARYYSPPKIILFRIPNVANKVMKEILEQYLLAALQELGNETTELIEIKHKIII